MGFRKTAIPLFIDLNTSVKVQKEQIVDLILSPSFYWVKRVSIPVKNLRELKKFLPSLFEDTLPNGMYSYYAYEDEDAYLIFAYDDKMILDILVEKGINPQQINKVYFAQSEFQDLKEAIAIDENFVLDVENRVILKLPKNFVTTFKPIELEGHVFSEHSITLARYAHIATTKSLIKFAIFMGALIAIYMLDWMVSEAKIAEFDAEHLKLYTEHKLPATKAQTEAMFETLQKQYEQQIKIRQITAEILNLKLGKNEYVDLYDLKDKKLKIEIKMLSSKQASVITKALQKKDLSLKNQYENGLLKLEFDL